MTRQEIEKEVKGKFFTVTFIKKDKSERVMNCRLGVKKYLKGVGKNYNVDDFNYLTVYDVKKEGYRTVNLNTVTSLKCNGKELWN